MPSKRGGARLKTRPDDKRGGARQTRRSDAQSRGPKPRALTTHNGARLRLAPLGSAEREQLAAAVQAADDATLEVWHSVVSELAMIIQVEFERRADAAEEG